MDEEAKSDMLTLELRQISKVLDSFRKSNVDLDLLHIFMRGLLYIFHIFLSF